MHNGQHKIMTEIDVKLNKWQWYNENDLENEVNDKKIKSYNTNTGFELTTYSITPERLAMGYVCSR